MKIAKSTFLFALVAAVLITGGIIATRGHEGTANSDGNKSDADQEESTNTIAVSQIEDWDQYELITDADDKWLGAGDCGTNDFSRFLDTAAAGKIYTAVLPGDLRVFWTPNYLGWGQETFAAFNQDSRAICGAGGRYPFRVVGDKLLWISSCGTGANYADAEQCEKSRELVDDYFQT